MTHMAEHQKKDSPPPTKSAQDALLRNRPTPRSGLPLKIHRFVASERFVHWGLAIPFVVLYVTAAAMLLLWAEPQPQYAHRTASWIHKIAGVCLIIFPTLALLRGSRDWRVHVGNVREAWTWTAKDFRWLLLSPLAAVDSRVHLPEQGRFNAAEKLNFMMVCVTYPLYIITGILIWLPDAAFIPWLLHLAMAALGLALVLGHIYMAAVNPSTRAGLEGMLTGWVDREWAKHHYRRWFRDTFERRVVRPPPARAGAAIAPRLAPVLETAPVRGSAPVHEPAAKREPIAPRAPAAMSAPAYAARTAPLAQSIPWSPTERGAPAEIAGTTPIYIRQRALASLHDHLRSAGNLNVLGFLVGDLCEDPGTRKHWIEIRVVVRLTQAIHGDNTAIVIARVWEHLQQELQRTGGQLLGWYLSHPFGQAELGPDEVEAHRQYFGKPWQFALAVAGGDRGAFYRPGGSSATAGGVLPFHEVLDPESITPQGTKRTRVTWKNYRPDVPLSPIETPAKVGAEGPAPVHAPAPSSIGTLLKSPAKIRCTTCGEIHSFQSWERLLQRIFQVEPLFCNNCKNELMPAVGGAAPDLAQTVLRHLQLSSPDEPLVP